MKRMKNLICMLILSILVTNAAEAQKATTNISRLILLAEKYESKYALKKIEAEKWAAERGLPVQTQLSTGVFIEIQEIVNSVPLYYATNNLNAARTISTDRVWPGGIAGLNLTGYGFTIGEWDGGGVLLTHQEFGGRARQRDYEPSTHYHSTHVAGTLIASGIIGSAKGMAPEANLDAYNWTNDESEMANAAASGLLISNHSYGAITGWEYDYRDDDKWAWFGDVTVSSVEDYGFGFYTGQSAEWDEIAYNAPYYMIVKSAGNDRNDGGPSPGEYHWVYINNQWTQRNTIRDRDGGTDGYDCIPGGGGVSKNTLTVGAVNDIAGGYSSPGDVSLTSFSSWGPTDDGRIKPDIVANGASLYSTYNSNNASYNRLNGTSMSAPNATGSLALLQEHYGNTHDEDAMLAATLKALVIHTADEAGSADGPDYRYGWGLMNTRSAADVITEDQACDSIIQELSLNINESYTLNVYSDGMEPLKATIAWTDPPGQPGPPQLNPTTTKLINDLDLKIVRKSDNQAFHPWTLNPMLPAQAAQRGVNTIDNVEQVFVSPPVPGEYSVEIEYNRSTSGYAQDVSLIISGVHFNGTPPVSASIIAPNVSANEGSELLVDIMVEETSLPIDAFGLKLVFDDDMLDFNRIEKGDLTQNFTYLQGMESQPGTIVIGGFDPNAVPANSNGSIVKVIFDVNCPACTQGDLSSLEILDPVDDLQDFNIVNGTVTYSRCLLGDVNMDNALTPEDALCAFRIYLNRGAVPADYPECDNECALTAADVTCDTGEITPQDALCIFRAYLDNEVPPMECCSGNALARKNDNVILDLEDVDGIPGEEIRIPLVLKNPGQLHAFGLELNYPAEKLDFVRSSNEHDIQVFESRVASKGILRIGGYDADGIALDPDESLLHVIFRVKDESVGTAVVQTRRLLDDLRGAESSSAAITIHGKKTGELDNAHLEKGYALHQNYPNPFNMETEISYRLAETGFTELSIYNSLGVHIRTIVSQNQDAGEHRAVWNGLDENSSPVGSGIYIYRIRTKNYQDSKKLVLIK